MQNDWAALWSLASPFVQWQTETTAAMATALGVSLPLTEASPLVLDLELGIRCNLEAFTQARCVPCGFDELLEES